MVFVSGSESVHIFRCLFMIADGDPIIKMEGWNPINRLNPATFVVPVSSQDLDFQRHMSWSFLCSES